MKNVQRYSFFNKLLTKAVYETSYSLKTQLSLQLLQSYNFKNQLQVKIQKEFKVTPEYIEINHDIDNGYEMGVYLCLGQQIWETNQSNALDFSKFNNFTNIHIYLENNDKVLILLGKGIHKIKKKAEQIACDEAINILNSFQKSSSL